MTVVEVGELCRTRAWNSGERTGGLGIHTSNSRMTALATSELPLVLIALVLLIRRSGGGCSLVIIVISRSKLLLCRCVCSRGAGGSLTRLRLVVILRLSRSTAVGLVLLGLVCAHSRDSHAIVLKLAQLARCINIRRLTRL